MSNANRVATFLPIKLNRRKGRCATLERRTHAAKPCDTPPIDSAVVALARAFYWQRLLDDGHVRSGAEIAEREGLHVSTVNELLRLALLDPHIVDQMLATFGPFVDATRINRVFPHV